MLRLHLKALQTNGIISVRSLILCVLSIAIAYVTPNLLSTFDNDLYSIAVLQQEEVKKVMVPFGTELNNEDYLKILIETSGDTPTGKLAANLLNTEFPPQSLIDLQTLNNTMIGFNNLAISENQMSEEAMSNLQGTLKTIYYLSNFIILFPVFCIGLTLLMASIIHCRNLRQFSAER